MRSQAASVAFILATLAADALGFGIIVPIVPELVRSLSGSDVSGAATWVGALLATFAAAQFVAAPVLGGLSDRFGRRPVIVLSLAGVGLNYLLLAFAPTLAWLFVGRLIAGATSANAAAANAYIADITPPERRAQRFGLVGAAFGFGFVFGPALGGVLGAIDLRLPFLAAAGLAFCNSLYGALLLPESLPAERRRRFDWSRANPIGSLRALARQSVTRRLAGTWSLMWFGLGALQSSFVLSSGLRFGWGPRENGYALAAVGISQAVVQGFFVRRVIRWLGERRAATTGFALEAIGFALFGFATAGWMYYAAIIVQALGAVATPAMRSLLSSSAGPDRQGELQGGLASVEGLTAIVSPVVASLLFSYFTSGGRLFAGAPFILGAITYGLAIVLLARSRVVNPS